MTMPVCIRLFIAVKTKEGFERDAEAVFFILCATLWTELVWHIYTAAVLARINKLAVFAVWIWAYVVRWQRINL